MTELRTTPVNPGELFSARVRQHGAERPPQRLRLLEAGCGWGHALDLGDLDFEIIGVDLDLPALRDRTSARADLDEWHLGDLRAVPMPPRAYDVVHAPYLIERLRNAELVLDRIVASLKPGGLLLVRMRDRDTAFGFLDRKVPRPLRRIAVRTAAGRVPLPVRASRHPHAPPEPDGPPEHASGGSLPPPAPTVYDRVASRAGMQWYCGMRGLVVAEEYTSRDCMTALGAGTGLVAAACRGVATASRGRLPATHSEIALVIRKPQNRYARVI
ncbi:class I SAM-dependent methyltransferase [Actinomadura gamaensis]|uniref:Class I SAM-dependent methyltransferase n=1 Tax=Actinomadura gamaensis TaxID=1763541 RepID=A0ABV9U3H2_9ACTN